MGGGLNSKGGSSVAVEQGRLYNYIRRSFYYKCIVGTLKTKAMSKCLLLNVVFYCEYTSSTTFKTLSFEMDP